MISIHNPFTPPPIILLFVIFILTNTRRQQIHMEEHKTDVLVKMLRLQLNTALALEVRTLVSLRGLSWTVLNTEL